MTTATIPETTLEAPAPSHRRWAAIRRYSSLKTNTGLGILLFFVLLATVGPLLDPGSPTAPGQVSMVGPSVHHLLGTTLEGQDVLRQLIDGTGNSLLVGFLAGALATIVAVVVGLLAGYVRGLGGELFSGLSNVFMVLPSLPLIIVLAGYLPRSGILSILLVIAVTSWAGGARVVRAQTLTMTQRDYVRSARAVGEPTWRILASEMLPNLAPIVMSTFLFAVIGAIAAEAGLAFLGLGDVNQISWGYMINLAQSNDAVLGGAWWWWLPPGICYALIGAALGLINFGLDEVANPRLAMVKLLAKLPAPVAAPAASADGRSSRGACAARGFEDPLLTVNGLSVGYQTPHGLIETVQDVDFQLGRGEILGIAGESGSGKSTLAHALTRLVHPPGFVLGGTVTFHPPGDAEPLNLYTASESELRAFRWEHLSIVFQSAMNALNPVMTIQTQLVDVIGAHRGDVSRQDAENRAAELLALVGVPRSRASAFPHELSGGTRQRVVIAMALALDPDLIVLDEPTTGLDVVVQREVVDHLLRLRDRFGFSILFITHDLSLLLETCDSVMVMYAGKVAEIGRASEIHEDPLHPYTRRLRDAFPPLHGDAHLEGIPGSPPDPAHPVSGCSFHPRCDRAFGPCATVDPEPIEGNHRFVRCHLHDPRFAGDSILEDSGSANGRAGTGRSMTKPVSASSDEVVLEARHFVKRFRVDRGRHKVTVRAVQDVSLAVRPERVTAVVGESGSGKSTLLRMLALLETTTSGELRLGGRVVNSGRVRRNLAYRSEVQMIFQDPFASLNPARTVGYQLRRALKLHDGAADEEALTALLEQVRLLPASRFVDRYPHELSGGQRQRVAIARALAAGPSVLLADEPISMLDVSMQVDVLNLLDDLRRSDRRLGIVYVTHNLASARYLADEAVVMYAGQLVEGGTPKAVTERPAHPYTQLLMRSAPDPGRAQTEQSKTIGEPPDLAALPTGCPFHPRCPAATDRCRRQAPPRFDVEGGHWANCWLLEQPAAEPIATGAA